MDTSDITFDIEEIQKQARQELYDEERRIAVEKAKVKILEKKPLMHKIFPWKLIVIRRDV